MYIFFEKESEERAKVTQISRGEPNDYMLSKEYIIKDSIPEPEEVEGKLSSLFCNPSTEKFWYEYEDRPLTQEEKINKLQNDIDYLILKFQNSYI